MDVVRFQSIEDLELRQEVQTLLDLAYEGDFAPEDWEHANGGVHFLGYVDDELVAHGAVVSRLMDIADATLAVGYVEAVAVHPAVQGNGLGTTLMRAITEHCASKFEVSMLSTDEHVFYARLGWRRFMGESYVRTFEGVRRTQDEDGGLMMLLPDTHLPLLTSMVICNDRPGDAW